MSSSQTSVVPERDDQKQYRKLFRIISIRKLHRTIRNNLCAMQTMETAIAPFLKINTPAAILKDRNLLKEVMKSCTMSVASTRDAFVDLVYNQDPALLEHLQFPDPAPEYLSESDSEEEEEEEELDSGLITEQFELMVSEYYGDPDDMSESLYEYVYDRYRNDYIDYAKNTSGVEFLNFNNTWVEQFKKHVEDYEKENCPVVVVLSCQDQL